MTDTYTPAWEYWGASWPLDTHLAWKATSKGDALILGLPDGLIGIQIDNSGQVDALAWAEAKHGELPRTWASNYSEQFGVRIYRVPDSYIWGGDFVTGNLPLVNDAILVAPSRHPSEYGQLLWRSPFAGWTSHPPTFNQILDLPEAWIPALGGRPMFDSPLEHKGMGLTIEDVVHKFAAATVVYSGSRDDRILTEELYSRFQEWMHWSGATGVNKINFSRVLATDWKWNRWAGRTEEGFRRGYWGIRWPEWDAA